MNLIENKTQFDYDGKSTALGLVAHVDSARLAQERRSNTRFDLDNGCHGTCIRQIRPQIVITSVLYHRLPK